MSTEGKDDPSPSPEAPVTFIRREEIPESLAILPLRNSVFFPGGVLPLAVGRPKTIGLVKQAIANDRVIGIVTQRRAEEEDPKLSDLYAIGTVSRIVKLLKMGEDKYSLVVQGLARFRVLGLVHDTPYLAARVELVAEKSLAEDPEVQALGISLKKLAREVIELMPELPAAATELVESVTHPGHLADLSAANMDVPIEQKQAVLETVDLKARMNLALKILALKREILVLTNKIDASVKATANADAQVYLRQQLQTIQRLLDEAGSSSAPQKPFPAAPRRVSWSETTALLRCSFCDRTQNSGEMVVQSRGALICQACVRICNDLLAEKT
jgi:ATP-dependent Lon protease